MKKTIASLLALIMTFTVGVTAFADKSESKAAVDEMMKGFDEEVDEYNEEIEFAFPTGYGQVSYSESVDFEAEKYAEKDARTIAKEKLIACGFSEDEAEGIMSDKLIDIMSSADKAVILNTYMKEEISGEESTLCSITRGEYNERLEAADTNNNAREGASSGSESSHNIDSGTLRLQIACAWDTDKASHVVVCGKFAWNTMPKYRGQDFFGISKDVYTTIDVTSFESLYQYIVQPYVVTNASGTPSLTWGKLTRHAVESAEDVGNNPSNGMVMSINVPGDLVPPTPIMGGAVSGYTNIKLTGACAFAVNIAQPSISPTEYLLWATYCHQSKSYSGSLSLSVPLGASISVEPSEKYEKASCAVNMHWAS